MSLPNQKGGYAMQYLIMLAIVTGLAISDFVLGIIKGYVTRTLSSKIMRKGGLNKLSEIIIMTTVCGLEIGINALGKYYGDKASGIASILGVVTAGGVLFYIVLMELLSMLENYSIINPNAKWAKRFIKRLKIMQEDEKEDKK